jgi:hypothetical protein
MTDSDADRYPRRWTVQSAFVVVVLAQQFLRVVERVGAWLPANR